MISILVQVTYLASQGRQRIKKSAIVSNVPIGSEQEVFEIIKAEVVRHERSNNIIIKDWVETE